MKKWLIFSVLTVLVLSTALMGTASAAADGEFSNVSVVKSANIYFNGQVTSRTVKFFDGSKKTLGIMMPGDYEFDTAAPEVMEIQKGELRVLLPGQNDWQTITAGQSFDVPGNAKFKLKVTAVTDYICSYVNVLVPPGIGNEFGSITAVKAANIYFNGQVTSRTVKFADGNKITLGIMLPGEYEFGTALAERMDITKGELKVLLPGQTSWQTITAGQSFNIPANTKFKLQVGTVVDYTCYYLK